MLSIVCVQVQNYAGRGELYVRKLHAAVTKHVIRPYRFVCVTDAPIDGIECIEPPKLRGWLTKIWLFEAFKEGETLFLDLDTFVMDSLEPLLDALAGMKIACLQNFYHEFVGASGVMYWEGDYSHIWKEYEQYGRPDCGTDEAWIIPRLKFPTFIQQLMPGKVLSFKGHCTAVEPPDGAILICFHGKPRPHEVGGWVSEAWDGTIQPVDKALHDLNIIVTTNTPMPQIEANIHSALERPGPFLGVREPNGKTLAICASGPSLKDNLWQVPADADVMALNGAYQWLLDEGVVPQYFAMLDAREVNTNFLQDPRQETEFFLALQCHPHCFDALQEMQHVTKFALASPSCMRATSHIPDVASFGGGATVGLAALALAAGLGYRHVMLLGYDSSFPNGERRVRPQPQNDNEILIDVWIEDRCHITTPAMAAQVRDFRGFLQAVTAQFPDFQADLLSGGLLRDSLETGQRQYEARTTEPSSPGVQAPGIFPTSATGTTSP